jgi:hypothetical protein
MAKKLIAKTQYLNPNLPVDVPAFAKAISIEPETDELAKPRTDREALAKRGTIYTIFNVNGGAGFDTNLVSKVAHDVLHDSYFQSNNISPIQSLEKAIAEVKNKIVHMTNESIHADEPPAEFSIIAGVLWGNVMYVVQYGSAQSYLVREGEMRPINTISEGTFSAASGVVKDGDVIIFCSQEFGKKYPPNKLLSMSIGEQELLPDEACILVKFSVDMSAPANEPMDYGLPEIPRKKETPKMVKSMSKMFAKLKNIKLPARVEKTKPVDSIGYSMGGANVRLKRKKFKFTPGMLIAVIVIALAASIFFTAKNKSSKNVQVAEQAKQEIPTPVVEGAAKVAETPDEQVFYDIKIADAEATPDGLAVFSNVVVATDSQTGKIYVSDQTTAKFEAETTTAVGIKNTLNIGGKLGFTDNEGYKVYDLANEKISESYKQAGLGVTSAYLEYVYTISGDKINRYSKATDTLKESLWGQSASFSGAKSMAIAYSVYIITSDGKLESYTSGTKDTFTLSGDNTNLNSPSQVVADIDLENIYVADNGNGRVVAYDDKGKFVKEYKPKKDGAWSNIKAIGVSSNEKSLFVLSGSKVFKLEI